MRFEAVQLFQPQLEPVDPRPLFFDVSFVVLGRIQDAIDQPGVDIIAQFAEKLPRVFDGCVLIYSNTIVNTFNPMALKL